MAERGGLNPHPPMFVVDEQEAARSSLSRLLRAIGVPTETYESAVAFLSAYSGDLVERWRATFA